MNKSEFIEEKLPSLKKFYYLATKEKLSVASQITSLLESDSRYDFDDVWGNYLDDVLDDITEEQSEYFDYNIERFDSEVYFPSDSKILPNGAWVKIRTTTGFEVHFAKKSHIKRRWEELIQKELTSVERFLSAKGSVKSGERLNRIDELMIRKKIGLQPYEIYVAKTKSSKKYFLTNEYEIIDDVETFAEAYIQGTVGVSSKKIYTSQNKDAVFYLQSRGIPKKVAEVMASLKQMYFTVNMNEAITEYNRQWEESLKSMGFTNEP